MTNSQLPAPAVPPAYASADAPQNFPANAANILKKGNGLGLASLIVGIVAFVGSVIPFINYGTGFIAFVGLVLGLVALALKERKKKAAIAGVVINVIALLLSIVLALAYTAGFVAAVDDAGVNVGESAAVAPAAGDDAATDTAAEEPAADLGTRDAPYPMGTTLSFTDSGAPFYDVTVGPSMLNANDIIAAENQFNEPPADGTQFAMLPLTVTYTGPDTGTPWLDFSVEFVTADGTTHTSSDVMAVEPSPLMDLNDLYTGGSGTGNVVVNVPSAGIETGTWLLKVGIFGGEEVFYAAQ